MERRPGDSEEQADDRGESENTAPEVGAFEIRRGAPRPATILRVADAIESRGGDILELFSEVRSASGQAVFPIHLRQGGREFFIEVETRTWDSQVAEGMLERASVLRSSEKSGAELRILSADPVPDDIGFLTSRAPAALLQLDLIGGGLDRPEEFAELFRSSAGGRWGTSLEYSAAFLPLVEELLEAAFDAYENGGGKPPVTDGLVGGLGCFLGEIIRRGASPEQPDSPSGSWERSEEWGESLVLEVEGFILDPIGKARAFMLEGAGDSISFYAGFVLAEIRGDGNRA